MTRKQKLAVAAFSGLFALGTMAAGQAFAADGKSSCKSASGCKGTAKAEKTNCKGHDAEAEKSSCKSASGCKGEAKEEKSSCKSASGCKGHEEKAEKSSCKSASGCKGEAKEEKSSCKGH